jgi:hypothetical protein
VKIWRTPKRFQAAAYTPKTNAPKTPEGRYAFGGFSLQILTSTINSLRRFICSLSDRLDLYSEYHWQRSNRASVAERLVALPPPAEEQRYVSIS